MMSNNDTRSLLARCTLLHANCKLRLISEIQELNSFNFHWCVDQLNSPPVYFPIYRETWIKFELSWHIFPSSFTGRHPVKAWQKAKLFSAPSLLPLGSAASVRKAEREMEGGKISLSLPVSLSICICLPIYQCIYTIYIYSSLYLSTYLTIVYLSSCLSV